MQPLLSPSSVRTPTNATGLEALQRKLEERPGNVMGIDPYLEKLLNAAKQALDGREQAFAQRKLLEDENQKLIQQNNEKKTRQHVKEKKIGDAKVMSYEDIVEAVRLRDRKDAEKKEKAARKTSNKASKQQANGRECTAAGEDERGLQEIEGAGLSAHCLTFTQDPSTHTSDQAVVASHGFEGDGLGYAPSSSDAWPVGDSTTEMIPWQAPVARMY